MKTTAHRRGRRAARARSRSSGCRGWVFFLLIAAGRSTGAALEFVAPRCAPRRRARRCWSLLGRWCRSRPRSWRCGARTGAASSRRLPGCSPWSPRSSVGAGALMLAARTPVERGRGRRSAVLAFGVPYFALPIAASTGSSSTTRGCVFLLLAIVWLGDTAAYYVGTALGPAQAGAGGLARRSAGRARSPASSTRLVATAVWSSGAARRGSTSPLLVVGAVTAVAAQVGDLVESLVKRGGGRQGLGRPAARATAASSTASTPCSSPRRCCSCCCAPGRLRRRRRDDAAAARAARRHRLDRPERARGRPPSSRTASSSSPLGALGTRPGGARGDRRASSGRGSSRWSTPRPRGGSRRELPAGVELVAGDGGARRRRHPPRRRPRGGGDGRRRRPAARRTPRSPPARTWRSPTRSRWSSPGGLLTELARRDRRRRSCRSTASTWRSTRRCAAAAPSEVRRLVLTASGGPFLRPRRRDLRRHPPRGGAAPSHLDDGREDHHRLGDAGQQGARADRGALALRRPARAHRRRGAPAVARALASSSCCDGSLARAALGQRHGLPDPVRARLARALGERVPAPATRRELGTLEFLPLDDAKFPAVALARRALAAGESAPAVSTPPTRSRSHAFLAGRIAFPAIVATIAGGARRARSRVRSARWRRRWRGTPGGAAAPSTGSASLRHRDSLTASIQGVPTG